MVERKSASVRDGKWMGNEGIQPDTYPKSRLPSTTSTEETTSRYPTDRCTPKPMDPKGEEPFKQYRSPGNAAMNRGEALDRATPRQGVHGDNAETFGRVGSGTPGKTSGNPYANSGNRSFERESFADNDLDSRYGKGLGKSG